MILPVFQPLGSSSHRIAEKIGLEKGEKATHTGTLDPMADGILIVLTGDDRFKKSEYSKWPKTYRFSILWGLQTDTDDSLGILQTPTSTALPENFNERLQELLPTLLGDQLQQLHPFSARRWAGKSSFEFARAKQPIPEKTREIKIYSLVAEPTTTLSLKEIHKEFDHRLELIKDGDWRQPEIQSSWNPLWENPETTTLPQTWFELHCSHGTYVRQLARDLSNSLKIPGLVWNLHRTHNGIYSKSNTKITYK